MTHRDTKRPTLLMSSQYIKGVGPSRQVMLQRLGIETLDDLLHHYPRRYFDRSDLVPIARIAPGETATFQATVLAVSHRKTGRARSLLTVAVGDETGIVNLVFFNQPYLERYFTQGASIIVSGSLSVYRGQKQINAPEYEIVAGQGEDSLLHTGRITPVYPLTTGISQRMMRRIIRNALDGYGGDVPENLPSPMIRRLGFPGRGEAIRQIHYPEDAASLGSAKRRLKFEEIFFLHLLLGARRLHLISKRPRPAVKPPYTRLERFLENLPFELTGAQQRVLAEIRADVEGEGLNRLVQGDVGSGKTVVGLAAMLMAVDCGYQAAMMAPTEILAGQHFQRIRDYAAGLDLDVELLIGSLGAGEKRRVQGELRAGRVDLVVGTHALIQEGVAFRKLGLAVIDEQHRFGVRQRASLGSDLPHFLVMTATPIPRSLAQTVYGDLDLSVIDEMPSGRRRVTTVLVPPDEWDGIYGELRGIFGKGGQAFILYPLVEETQRSDLRAATGAYERLQEGQLSGWPIGILHGRMSYEEKSKAIEMFRAGDIAALVTTTVIEVGVDVPNASALVIHNPERFGLSQLHQLRGRVGRGGQQGICYLMLEDGTQQRTGERLRFFAANDDGFRVAEEDLRTRGPGEIWGIRQSGYPAFRIVNPLTDREIVELSWSEAGRLLERDPDMRDPENRAVARYLETYYRPRMELADIG